MGLLSFAFFRVGSGTASVELMGMGVEPIIFPSAMFRNLLSSLSSDSSVRNLSW